uniref:Baculoviral IAP repeat-containing protein 5 n=1 Tax=Sarcophilus harrisii TaxID=9305 RepID=A0A7N4NZ59_SARHA
MFCQKEAQSQVTSTCDLIIAVGQHDSPEFHQQSLDYFQVLRLHGWRVSFIEISNVDHFDIIEKLMQNEYILTQMAEAGFIHCPSENEPDLAQCFFCFKELEGWEPEDDPMLEHKKHSSSCAFISIKKKIEELTLNEFLKLDKERAKNKIEKETSRKRIEFEERAKEVRHDIEQLAALE